MSVSLRLSRGGAKKRPYYKIVVSNSRSPRDGKFLEQVGTYNPLLPKDAEDRVRLIEDRVRYWLGVGAQPTEAVTAILKVTGDWQKFKGLPGTEGTLRVAAPKPEKRLAYEAAVKEAMNEPADGATTAKKKAADKLAAKSAPAVEEVKEAVEEIVTEAVAEAIVEEAVAEATAEVVAEAEAATEAAAE